MVSLRIAILLLQTAVKDSIDAWANPSCIGRDLVTQYCNYSLQFEACGWDILTREVTNVECLDVFLECVPLLLITDDHTFYDEPKHRDGTTLIFGKIGEVGLYFRSKGSFHRQKEGAFKPIIALNLNIGAIVQDKLLPGGILVIFEVVIVINCAQPFCGWSNVGGSKLLGRDSLRYLGDGQHIILNDVSLDSFQDSLGGKSIACHIIIAFIIGRENSTDLAGMDFWLDGLDYLLASLLTSNWSIPAIVLEKDYSVDRLIAQAREGSDLKSSCECLKSKRR
jgi:hypothetical protein